MNDDETKEKYQTTVVLRGEAYSLIRKKQNKIFDKTSKKISIQDLVYEHLMKSMNQPYNKEIDNIGEELWK